MNPPQIPADVGRGAVDLRPKQADDRAEKARLDAEREAKNAQLQGEAMAWDRAMNRAFKGIAPRNERRANLMRRVRAEERAARA